MRHLPLNRTGADVQARLAELDMMLDGASGEEVGRVVGYLIRHPPVPTPRPPASGPSTRLHFAQTYR